MPHDAGTRNAVLANARLVLADEVVTGALVVEDDRIAAIETGAGVPAGAEDLGGDFLAPGLVELHTDNLERHLEPRPGVRWPEIAGDPRPRRRARRLRHHHRLRRAAGRLARGGGRTGYGAYARPLADAILRLAGAGALRISHRLHLRAETCSETLTEEIADFGPDDRVGIVSLMDHTPGQRQFADIEKLKLYAMGRRDISEEDFRRHVADMTGLGERNAARAPEVAIAAARRFGATIASHDDATRQHVAASAPSGRPHRRVSDQPGRGRRRARRASR